MVEEIIKCDNCHSKTDGIIIIFNQGEKVMSLCKYCSANLQEILYCYLKEKNYLSDITKKKFDVTINKIGDNKNELNILNYKIVLNDRHV